MNDLLHADHNYVGHKNWVSEQTVWNRDRSSIQKLVTQMY
jgi:hypothetical protein